MKLLGQGRTAQIFDYDENKIVKLFYEGKSDTDAKKEFMNLQIVNSLNIPSPKVYELTNIENRIGIIEEKLIGTDGLEILSTSKQPEFFLQTMVILQKQLNSSQFTPTKTLNCISYKDSLKGSLWSVTDKQEKERICKKIDSLPDGNFLCHGDYHPGNIFVKQDGTYIIIDFVNLCHGPALFDIARTYFLIAKGELPPELSEQEAKQFNELRTKLANAYLTLMETTEAELSTYIDVIAEVRKYELN